MPRGDGTGPGGMGPMTGRAAGFCAGYDVPGFANPAPGGGYGFGRGGGRGFGRGRGGGGFGRRNMYYATGLPGWARYGYGAYPAPVQTPDPETEKRILQTQAESLESELKAMKKRLSELEEKQSSE